jgi:hypothetical protein
VRDRHDSGKAGDGIFAFVICEAGRERSAAPHIWIHPGLDEFIVNDWRRAQVLELLESLTVQHGVTREAEQTASLIAKLLRGELETDESSPLDYMVSGIHPYKW